MFHRRAAIGLLIAATAVPLSRAPSPAGALPAVNAAATTVPAVGGAPSKKGGGWEAFADGRVVPFGGAPTLGDLAGAALARPIVGIAATPSGGGYWLVASDGGVFTFGDARFHGSTGGVRLDKPVVGVASTPTGNGYWLVASDGGVFTFGDARFHGSTGGVRLARPVVGMAASGTGNGYWLVASDGGLFSFGDSRFAGSLSASGSHISGMAAAPGGVGYYLVTAAGSVVPFGIPSPSVASSTSTPMSPSALLTAALAGQKKLFGLSPNGNSKGIPTVPTIASEVSHPVQIINVFMGWNQPLPVTSLQAIAAQGAIPELTWEQWPAGGGPNQPAYADSVITSGQYDTYIRSVATAAKAWNGPILLRYGHEMNGNWYPWAASVNGNTPAAFVAAWQHVHHIFTTAGVTDVKW
ncbi:MAG TPA: hypothetical protein VKI19_11520, partial [Acidimicrobiales bacterium]|nr:hypothetical protein [Acidimicrobiales bacterium]